MIEFFDKIKVFGEVEDSLVEKESLAANLQRPVFDVLHVEKKSVCHVGEQNSFEV
jgi:hypothetical protein